MQHHWALKEAPANGLRGCEACFAAGQLHHGPLPLRSGCMRTHRAWKQPGATQKQTPAEGRHARKVSETSSSALSQAPWTEGCGSPEQTWDRDSVTHAGGKLCWAPELASGFQGG